MQITAMEENGADRCQTETGRLAAAHRGRAENAGLQPVKTAPSAGVAVGFRQGRSFGSAPRPVPVLKLASATGWRTQAIRSSSGRPSVGNLLYLRPLPGCGRSGPWRARGALSGASRAFGLLRGVCGSACLACGRQLSFWAKPGIFHLAITCREYNSPRRKSETVSDRF